MEESENIASGRRRILSDWKYCCLKIVKQDVTTVSQHRYLQNLVYVADYGGTYIGLTGESSQAFLINQPPRRMPQRITGNYIYVHWTVFHSLSLFIEPKLKYINGEHLTRAVKTGNMQTQSIAKENITDKISNEK